MSQKAICPRGHIWDPSTLSGLPPTDRPRCPICGEAEPRRARHLLAGMGRWCRRNPLLAGLSLACLLFLVLFVVTLVRLGTETQTLRAEAEKAEQQAAKVRHDAELTKQALRVPEDGDIGQQRGRAAKMEAAKWRDQLEELRAELRQAKEWRADAVNQRDEQAARRKVAEELAKDAELVRQEALDHRKESARQLVQMHAANGTRLMENGDLAPALLWFAEALRLAHKERLPEETHRLRVAAVLAQCPRPMQLWASKSKLHAARLSPDGKRVLTAAADGAVVVRDAATGKRVGEALAHPAAVLLAEFSPDGKRALTATADATVHLWDLESGKEAFPALQFMGAIVGLSFSPDGRHFLSVARKPAMPPATAMDAELRVWNAATGEALGEQALASDLALRPAAFSPDGKRVLTIGQDRTARMWDITAEKQIGPTFSHAAALVQASFSPEGERVLTASADGTARIWRTESGEPIGSPLKHGSAILAASFDPNGRFVLTDGDDRRVRVWDAKTGEAAGPPLRHADAVSRAVFSADGRYVLTACADGAARLWDYTTGVEALPALNHGWPIDEAAFAPGSDIALTRAGQVVRLWDLTASESPRPPVPPTKALLSVFSADGKYELRVTESAIRVYDTRTKQAIGGTLPHKNRVTAAAFSADAKYVLTVSHQPNGDELEGHIRVWETATGRPIGEPLIHPRSVLAASFSPEGKQVLTACQDRRARLWDVKKSIVVGEPMEHKEDLARALFLPGGERILTLDVEGGLRLWNAGNAEAVGPTWGHQKPIHHLAFRPDGKQLVTACEDGTATVWEADTGREVTTTAAHGAPVLFAAFSPDGKRLVAVSADRRARVWDAQTGKPVTRPLRHRAAVARASFSGEGRRVATVAADGVRLWDAASGEPLSPVLRFGKDRPAIQEVAFGKDGRLVLSSGSLGDPSARWTRDFRADPRPASDLLLVAEILDGERLAGVGVETPLDAAELDKAWQAMRKKDNKDFTPKADRISAWHRRGAAECEQRKLWLGAVRHLDRLLASGESTELHARRGQANAALQRWQAAKADYTKALAGDAARGDLWAERAAVESALRQWEEAAADYSKAIERKGSRADWWAGRGRTEAERGEWKKAAVDLGKAIHLGQSDFTVWHQRALTLLPAGEEAEFRRTCGRLMQHFRGKEESARALAWTCALAAGAVPDLKPLVQRAERAVNANPKSAAEQSRLAVLLYRSGQFDAAGKHAEEATRLPDAEGRDWLVLAMAAQRLGHGEDAKKALEKAEQVHGAKKTAEQKWEARLIYQTLHREAETLVKGTKK